MRTNGRRVRITKSETTMTLRAQSALLLVAIFLLGGLVGGVLVGTIAGDRHERRERFGHRGGFVEHMENVIDPVNDEQRVVIRPILERIDSLHHATLKQAHHTVRASFDTLMAQLAPHLKPDQLERLRTEHRRMDRHGPPPPRGRRR